MKVLVLAAGFATRLYPLTRHQPKALLEVGGKPVLTHLLEKVWPLPDLQEIWVVSNQRFASTFEAWAQALQAPVPIHVLNDGATEDDNKIGGVGDLQFGLQAIAEKEGGRSDSEVLVLGGDNLIEFELLPYWREFQKEKSPLLLAEALPKLPPARRYGEIMLNSEGTVLRFREKPEVPESLLAATCLYCFPPGMEDWLNRYFEEGGDPDAPGRFFEWLVPRTKVRAVAFQGRRWDIGNLEILEAARAAYS